jgi:hypothetical protein
MTLVIVQKRKSEISICSDSRFNYKSAGTFDFGIKVSSIKVQIFSPYDEQGNRTLDYDHKIGVGVTGSTTAAYTIKEYVSEALMNLQHTPGYTDFSFEGISNFVLKFYKKICSELTTLFRKDGLCQVILVGYCPLEDKVRTFLLDTDLSDYPIKFTSTEILKDDGIEFYGSGKSEAKKVIELYPHYSPLNILRRVIFEGRVPSVGGGLQHGSISHKDFYIQGLMVESPTNVNPNHCDFMLWGISHYEGEFEEDENGFLLNMSFIMEYGALSPNDVK